MFLEILGILFLVLLAGVLYFTWKTRRFFKANVHIDITKAMSALPVMDLVLEGSNASEWKDSARLKTEETTLKRMGASHDGYFCVYGLDHTIQVSIWNYKNQLVVAFYEVVSDIDTSQPRWFMDIVSKTNNGSFGVTTNQHAVLDQRPENHKIVFSEAPNVDGLLRAFKAELPGGAKVKKIDKSLVFFEECYEAVAEWAWRSEQLRSNKTQQIIASTGVENLEQVTDELVEMGLDYSIEVNTKKARKLLASNIGVNMSVEQWEKIRDKLVFTNELMTAEHLAGVVYELAGELTEAQEVVLEDFQENSKNLSDPISAFQMLSSTLNLKVKRIATMEKPVKTEVYLPI